MSIVSLSAAHAMGGYISGKTGKQIRDNQKKVFGAFGNNIHANGWAHMADRDNRGGSSREDDDDRCR